MEKRILICIAYYKNAEMLLKRGTELAKGLNGFCYALTITRDIDETQYEYSHEMEIIEALASKYNVPLLKESIYGRKIADIISHVTVDNNMNHVIIGQPVQNKWDMIVKGSLVNDLLTKLKQVDLTIVEVSKEKVQYVSEYEAGTSAFVFKEDGIYKLSLDRPKSFVLEGIFYQSTKTDFQTGIFKSKKHNEVFVLSIIDGEIKWKSNEKLLATN
ncbi:hypothetical protein HXA31_07990 [Salipaludibacillus agaradhaerens]|jgi:two-component system sensor histidine kinase KdpD|uniref:Osmosensitive K+ channel histidine kinase n=1 Tax=Salipaludibacillus agaradhaerens TaxID=76935 RepID=A0A9Q4B0M1_SALAG|nr:hypothetical protein [Salipaludibacillus agaradhaerens]MCR6096134.1 hypothetical protein [Salipaludibacillus agaradhaerens]MCR6114307.1 hypothetical protein [Salipaludibacillus agaradhaerens]